MCNMSVDFAVDVGRRQLTPVWDKPDFEILEGRTNISECIFEPLFKDVSTVFGLRSVESLLGLPKSSFGE